MEADAARPDDRMNAQGAYRRLPPPTRLEETIDTFDADPTPDPQAGRNLDQHRALRDD